MLLPPIGFLAVMQYHKENFVDWQKAAIICATFIIGSYFGAKLALSLPVVALKKVFAVFLLLVAAKYLFLDK
ncbi:MAG: hypothetical protein EBX41_07860 [Chitinophagia bacterium]|nr:hypothetical protein [Chitinophagia bacterium]